MLGSSLSADDESFSNGLLEYPHYTRPQVYQGLKVPEVLLSGNHKEIERWRKKESLRNTLKKRPDLLEKANLDLEEGRLIDEIKNNK